MTSSRPVPARALAALVLVAASSPSSSTPVAISNTVLRRDMLGRVVNAHDGGLYRFSASGLFWQYGTVYEDCVQAGPVCDGKCGYLGNVFAAYSSPDLATWTLESANVLPELSNDNDHISYWEANVGFNAATSMYVMLYWSGHFGFVNASVAVAMAPSPAGPFLNAAPIAMRGATVISDTVALFVDDDGTAYARYNTRDAPLRHVVEKLAPDWLSSSGEHATIFSKQQFPWYDGGGMWKREQTYYVMLSFDCCFCSWGSDALVFTAPAPLGPWAPQAPRAAARAAAQRLLPLPRIGGVACVFDGDWSGVLGNASVGPPNLRLLLEGGNALQVSGAVSTTGVYHPENASVVFAAFPGYGRVLVGAVSAFAGSDDSCSRIDWLDYTPEHSFWCRHPDCGAAPVQPSNFTNEVNACADGRNPPATIADMNINPCSQDNVFGLNFTVPAQQFAVAVLLGVSLASRGGPADGAYLFYGEHFKSAADGLKSHDLQAWVPLTFDSEGRVEAMRWLDNFTLYVS